MLIFSRNRGPWVVTAFVVVVATGSFIKFHADAEKEAAAIEKDKQSFVAFNQSVQKELGKAHKLINSELLFEFYRCGILSNREKSYCNAKTDEVFKQLNSEQQKALVPVFKKFFMPE